MISSFMLLRADAGVLGRVLSPLVAAGELGPVVERLLAAASEADDLVEIRREMEAREATVNALLEYRLSGARRASDLEASAPAEVVSLTSTVVSALPEVLGAAPVESSTLVEAIREGREGFNDAFRLRAEGDGWHPPTAGERGLVLRWPADVAPRDVEDWLAGAPDQAGAERLREAIRHGAPFNWSWAADLVLQTTRRAQESGSDPRGWPWEATHHVALLVLAAQAFGAHQAMQRDRERPFTALPASRAHHAFVSGVRDLPKGREGTEKTGEDGWVEIIAPGGGIGLKLDVHDIPEQVVHAVRRWRGWEGLRHWAALLRMLTIEGRTGFLRWKLDAHLDALGYGDRARRDPAVRRLIANEVEALTRLELAIYHPSGKLRMSGRLFTVTQRAERISGSEWALEGLELAVHRGLYEGVRSPTGAIGSLWAPAPADLARIDHIHHPHALALGLILPIRWRWDLDQNRACVTLSGKALLEAAGLTLDPRRPGETWETLERNLDALERVGGLGKAEWDHGARRTLGGMCRLYPPQWMRDRMVHRLPPVEPPRVPSILTGGELHAWRGSKGWTQAQAAEALGISPRTIRRAESEPGEALGWSFAKAFARLRGQ